MYIHKQYKNFCNPTNIKTIEKIQSKKHVNIKPKVTPCFVSHFVLWTFIIKQEAHGPHRSPEEDFYIFSILFYKLAINSPCRRAWLLFLKKSEFPLPKDASCQVWLKLAL